MVFDFTGKVIAITGGASGIGAATARAAAGVGARVAVLDVNDQLGAAVAGEHENITFHHMDVADHDGGAVHDAVPPDGGWAGSAGGVSGRGSPPRVARLSRPGCAACRNGKRWPQAPHQHSQQ